ncbi:hypothetical protein [Plastoroseomonas hellenica]|uniref:hypothetical protein n=1 Tax=Plastoroseomonas hellenica TaxID=2687306 RepID=UPI001BA6BD04|nr:hypothetical protein [Plastoroseomonas hellenica]MBR0641603.1 hypothetical protein [Plastoroseomonas hellenica]
MPFDPPFRTTFQAGDMVFGYANCVAGWIQSHLGEGASDASKIQVYDTDAEVAKKITAVSDANEFVQALVGHPKYNIVVRDEPNGIPGISGNMNREWRIKSKGALHYFTKVAKKHVHFVLDDIDLDEVVSKSHTSGPPYGRDKPVGKAGPSDTKTRTVTHAELRWIYRNRVSPDVQAGVQFWLNGTACTPPWQSGGGVALWSKYTPTNPVIV